MENNFYYFLILRGLNAFSLSIIFYFHWKIKDLEKKKKLKFNTKIYKNLSYIENKF